jgi:3-oxoacyl-[acyl-carrier-protein] synthase-3
LSPEANAVADPAAVADLAAVADPAAVAKAAAVAARFAVTEREAAAERPVAAPLGVGRPGGSLRSAGIVGLGGALPQRRVSSEEIAQRLGLEDGWIERRTGIRERRYAAAGERVSELATRAGAAALQDAGVDAAQVDLVLVATVAADEITPSAAPIVAHALGTSNAAAVDIGAACTGTLAALALASAWIEAARADVVLVVGAEIMSRFVDPNDRRTAPLFGDGAGALVMAAGAQGNLGPVLLGSDGGAAEMIQAPRHTGVLEMEGHETFRRAVRQLHLSTRRVLERAGWRLQDVDLFVYHQANARILAAVAERLGVEHGRVFDCIAETGNTSAASLPLALAQARQQGLLQAGAKVVVGAVGAGLTWGAGVLEWGL